MSIGGAVLNAVITQRELSVQKPLPPRSGMGLERELLI